MYENGKYVGEFFQDARLGNGTMYFNDGCVYEGEWFFDYMSGKGSFTWPSGDKYVGDFLNNYRTGEGIYYFGEGKWQGDRYEGEFLNEVTSGNGNTFVPQNYKPEKKKKKNTFEIILTQSIYLLVSH